MTTRVPVAPAVLEWALDIAGGDPDEIRDRFKVDAWAAGEQSPTLNQLRRFAAATGVGFGYLLLSDPPAWELPLPDFREGFAAPPMPSADLVAVLSLSQQRQEWYRNYAISSGADELGFVGSARSLGPMEAADRIRAALGFEVADRRGSWTETRRELLRSFEALGGLTIATSMVGNNTRRLLDEDEFRGFALVDPIVPLVFINANQTMNGQLFTLAHEFAHVWRGSSGIGDEDPRRRASSAVEQWCNAVAAQVLVPTDVLESVYPDVRDRELASMLDELAGVFRCGTLAVLHALHRSGVRSFSNFGQIYDRELARLHALQSSREVRHGGDHYNNQPFRVGERLSRAVIADTLEGRTTIDEAMRLMSMKSLSTFDEYARRLGAA